MAARELTLATIHMEEQVDAFEDMPDWDRPRSTIATVGAFHDESTDHLSQQSSSSHSSSTVVRNGKLRSPMEKPAEPEVCVAYTTIFGEEHGTALLSPTVLSTARLEAKIVDFERDKALLSPIVYHIELSYGQFKWTIRRRYNHYRHLHDQIWLFYQKLNLPLPTVSSTIRETKKALAEMGDKVEFPKFPHLPEIFVYDGVAERMNLLDKYLQYLLDIPFFRQHPAVLNFLEISPYSFIAELGHKGKEFLVKKRAGGFRSPTYCTRIENFFTDLTGHWRKRWLVAKDTCLFYIEPDSKKIRYVMLYDRDFYADAGLKQLGVPSGVRIRNQQRQLVLKCWNTRKANELAEYLNKNSKFYASDFVTRNRFESFAPIREATKAQWFVDGAAYFEAVLAAIFEAREEIYITDWWLSPEIYLKRPGLQLHWRLDCLLKKKAAQGVKVFVLLYKEMEMGISINSIYTKRTLMKAHKNILVLRHPDAVRGGPLLWSHHEKLVVIDQAWAFVGGIDLCFGRWDNFEHRLTDLGGISFKASLETPILNSTRPSAGLTQASSGRRNSLGFIATSNPSLAGSLRLRRSSVDNSSLGSIGENDQEVEQTSGNGQADAGFNNNPKDKNDKGVGFRHLFSNKVKTTVIAVNRFKKRHTDRMRERRSSFIASPESCDDQSSLGDPSLREDSFFYIRQHLPLIDADQANEPKTPTDLEGAAKLWHGKDYTNFIVKDFCNLDQPFRDSIDRNTTPRMPWHDLSCLLVGAAARDVARHFIQRWNHTKFGKVKFDDRYSWLVPRSYQHAHDIQPPKFMSRAHKASVQVLRSVSSWSLGIKRTEASIAEAYIEVINNADHYIYIENQFFISQTRTHLEPEDVVKNRVAEAIYRRIIRAHRSGQKFRVFVLIPLLPAFEGELGTTTGMPMQQITHFNYSTICKGSDSILSKLSETIQDPSEYIGFYSLRNWDQLNGRLVTELVYIHSKLLLADDKVAIIGSSNINDRSLLGMRDSEVCVIIEDEEFERHTMNGQTYRAGKFSGSLRRLLMAEHLGLYKHAHGQLTADISLVEDPVSDYFWHNVWNRAAAENTRIFEEVFAVIPSNEIRTLANIGPYMDMPKLGKIDPEKAKLRLETIQGHLVQLPLDFLIDESDRSAGNAQDHIIPQVLWT